MNLFKLVNLKLREEKVVLNVAQRQLSIKSHNSKVGANEGQITPLLPLDGLELDEGTYVFII